jgi:hypothetical protein
MKRATPTDREIEELIAPAFDRLPAPDAGRLAVIEQRLLERTRSRGRSKFVWWWLAGALVAGTASALWWAVDYDSDQRQGAPAPAITSPVPAQQPARPDKPVGAESAPKQGPKIYQREQ